MQPYVVGQTVELLWFGIWIPATVTHVTSRVICVKSDHIYSKHRNQTQRIGKHTIASRIRAL